MLVKYGRYIIGTIEKEETLYVLPTPGQLSPVPYAEPTWLTPGFKSPCALPESDPAGADLDPDYNDSHRALQKFMRKFADEVVLPEAHEHEKTGKRPSIELIQKMGELHINAMVRSIVLLRGSG